MLHFCQHILEKCYQFKSLVTYFLLDMLLTKHLLIVQLLFPHFCIPVASTSELLFNLKFKTSTCNAAYVNKVAVSEICKTLDFVLLYSVFCLNELILCLKLVVLPQYFKNTTKVKSEGRARSGEQTIRTVPSVLAELPPRPTLTQYSAQRCWLCACLAEESMSTSLLLPHRLHQGVRWIYKEAHANRTAPLQDPERWPDEGRVVPVITRRKEGRNRFDH